MDPQTVTKLLDRLLPVLESIDLDESERLQQARQQMPERQAETKSVLRSKICSLWPVVQKFCSGDVPCTLPMATLSPIQFLPFIREIESIVLDEGIEPVIVYWARHSATKLLPGEACYSELIKAATCVTTFSEHRTKPPDEWMFVVEGQELSLALYGRQGQENDREEADENLDPRALDDRDPDPSGVPKRPYPFVGQSDIAIPEPEVPTET